MVKTYKDYIEPLQKVYPFLSQDQIDKILLYGLKNYCSAVRNKVDVVFFTTFEGVNTRCQIVSLTGDLTNNALKRYKYWHMKWRMKERWLNKQRKIPWDGYYYFGVSDKVHKELGKHPRTIEHVYLSKIKKELYHFHWVKHIWRVAFPTDVGYRFWVDKMKSDNIEYVGKNYYEIYHKYFQWGNRNRSTSDDQRSDNDDGRIERNDNNG